MLRTCVTHRHKAVQKEAIFSLQKIGTPQAQRILMECLTNEDPNVRVEAAEALEALNSYCDIEPILDIVRHRTFHSRSIREKKALLSVLGKVCTEQSSHILEMLLHKRSLWYRKRFRETRACAALALGALNPDAAQRLLNQSCGGLSPAVRRICIQASQKDRSRH